MLYNVDGFWRARHIRNFRSVPDGHKRCGLTCCSGIGYQASILFANEGAAVVCADVNEVAAQKVADEIQANGGKVGKWRQLSDQKS